MACQNRQEGALRAQKRKHVFPEGSNKCSSCGHVTTHGANKRRAEEFQRLEALRPKKARPAEIQ
jgi:hypothetical protein